MKKRQEPLSLNEFRKSFPDVPRRAASAVRCGLGNGMEQLVEQITDEVVMQLWGRQRAGTLPDNPGVMAYSIAWGRALNHVRRQGGTRRRPAGYLNADPGAKPDASLPPPGKFTPLLDGEFMDKFAAIQKALDAFHIAAATELDPEGTLIFEALYVHRLSIAEVAREHGLEPELLRRRWSRMMTRLLGRVRLNLESDPQSYNLLLAVLRNEANHRGRLPDLVGLVMAEWMGKLRKLVGMMLKK